MNTRIKNLLVWVFRPRPIVAGIVVMIVVATGVGLGWWRTQRAFAISLANKQAVRVNGPLRVVFNQEVAAGIKATLTPAVEGVWKEERSVLGVQAVSFTPKSKLEAGQQYSLRISNMKRVVTGASIPDVAESFVAQVPPAIVSVTPKDKMVDLGVRPKFVVTLSAANQGLRDLQPALEPATKLKLVSSNDKVFVWEPATDLKQGTAYTFILNDNNVSKVEKRRLVTAGFATVVQPGIVTARAGDHLVPGQVIDIVFDRAMDSATDGFVFDMKGKGVWFNDRTFRFTPDDLKPGTKYAYRVKAGVRSTVGGVVEADRGFEITTNGAVTATSLVPTGGGIAPNAPIRVTFDQAVDHASAESRFGITPKVSGGFSWSGNTMTFNPVGMAYETAYSYTVASGVAPVWGLPSAKAWSGSFTTITETIKLNVPAYKGQYWMACELSSLRMLLAYRGIKVDDWGVLMHLHYNPRARDLATNTWDDPNQMYVGFVDGRPNKTGYGVHAGPLAQAGRDFGRNTQAYFGVSAQFISKSIHDGNPVAFYSYSDAAPRADSWNTDHGVVQTMYPQHARVIYGVKGSVDNPQGFYINEPMNASSFYWSTAEVMNHMNAIPGVSNQAVVVY